MTKLVHKHMIYLLPKLHVCTALVTGLSQAGRSMSSCGDWRGQTLAVMAAVQYSGTATISPVTSYIVGCLPRVFLATSAHDSDR